jgi:hypothetical protein
MLADARRRCDIQTQLGIHNQSLLAHTPGSKPKGASHFEPERILHLPALPKTAWTGVRPFEPGEGWGVKWIRAEAARGGLAQLHRLRLFASDGPMAFRSSPRVQFSPMRHTSRAIKVAYTSTCGEILRRIWTLVLLWAI